MLGNCSIVLGCLDLGITVHHGEGFPWLAALSVLFAIADLLRHHWATHSHIYVGMRS
jgi:hypothetical protein